MRNYCACHCFQVVRETWWPYMVWGVCVHCGHRVVYETGEAE